jgi:hypothetical protein
MNELFRFGLVSDVQYAVCPCAGPALLSSSHAACSQEADPVTNYTKTATRYYRDALVKYTACIEVPAAQLSCLASRFTINQCAGLVCQRASSPLCAAAWRLSRWPQQETYAYPQLLFDLHITNSCWPTDSTSSESLQKLLAVTAKAPFPVNFSLSAKYTQAHGISCSSDLSSHGQPRALQLSSPHSQSTPCARGRAGTVVKPNCWHNKPSLTLFLFPQSSGRMYYSFLPQPGFRVVVLYGYEIGLLGCEPGTPEHTLALHYMALNPNEDKSSNAGLEGNMKR